MSILSKLTVVAETRPNAQVKKGEYVDNFINNINKQIDNAKKEKGGIELPPRTRRSYWQKGNKWYVTVSYGSQPLDLGNGHGTIEAGKSIDDVLKVLAMLIEAATAGELTAQIEAAAAEKGQALKDGKAAAKAKKAAEAAAS